MDKKIKFDRLPTETTIESSEEAWGGKEYKGLTTPEVRLHLKQILGGMVQMLSHKETIYVLRNLKSLEKFIDKLRTKGGKSAFEFGEDDKRMELRSMVDLIIDRLEADTIEELLRNPDNLIDFFENPLEDRQEVSDELVKKMEAIATTNWNEFWNMDKEEIQEVFLNYSLEVSVEYLEGKDFMIISLGNQGVVLPKPGSILNVADAFDFFEGAKPGMEITGISEELPMVRKEKLANKKTFWRVIKKAKIN